MIGLELYPEVQVKQSVSEMNVYNMGCYMVDECLENFVHKVKKEEDLVTLNNDKSTSEV